MSNQDGRWTAKRRQVIWRAHGRCERCKEAKGVHVHHLRYFPLGDPRRQGGEPLDWLQLVCLACHEFYHPHHDFTGKRKIWKARRRNATPHTRQERTDCRHCGGSYNKRRHHAICVKHGLV